LHIISAIKAKGELAMNRKLQAIILAGGKGTRLSPLTQTTPKPNLRILGKRVIETVLERLKSAGLDKAVITTMYLAEQTEGLGREIGGVAVSFERENEPLGTAGAVRNAYDGESDDVIVLSGDGVFDFDLTQAISAHYEKNADVTIVTTRVEEPSEYGIVISDESRRVVSFVEKPPWDRVLSPNVNTGIYILSRSVLESIPENECYDFSKQLFPKLMEQGKQLFSIHLDGYWCDIGNLDAYFYCNAACLDGKVKSISGGGVSAEKLSEEGVDCSDKVFVSENAHIGKNVRLGAYTVISENASVADGCDISESLLASGVKIGGGCSVNGAMIGENCIIGENCVISEGCVIGGYGKIGDGEIIKKHTHLHAHSNVTEEEKMKLSFRSNSGAMFTDNGILCSSQLGTEHYTKLGRSIALSLISEKCEDKSQKLKHDNDMFLRVGVMSDFGINAVLHAKSLICGASSAGVHCVDFGKGYESLARFASLSLNCDIVIFVSRAGEDTIVKMFDANARTVSHEFERRLSATFFSDPEFEKAANIFETESFSSIGTLYYSQLVKSVSERFGKNALCGFECWVESFGVPMSISPSNMLINAINELGGKVTQKTDSKIRFCVAYDGTDAACEEGALVCDFTHMGAVLIECEARNGCRSFKFPSSVPQAYRVLAAKNRASTDKDGADSAEVSHDSALWLNDGIFASLRLCAFLHNEKASLSELMASIPRFEVYRDEFIGNKDRASVMEKLSKLDNSENTDTEHEGVKLVLAGGTVTVIPERRRGFKIISEAVSIEAAKELCLKIEDIIGKEK